MIKESITTAFLTTLMALHATGHATLAQDKAQEPKPATAAAAAKSDPALADRLKLILADYQAQQDAMRSAQAKATTPREQGEIATRLSPDDMAFSRRMTDLALTKPEDTAARDALIWVINTPGQSYGEDYLGEFGRAATLLVLYHGDDPEAVCVGLNVVNLVTAHRDTLLYGFYASAKGRQAKGLARLALGQYLFEKAQTVESAKAGDGKREKTVYAGVIGDDGKIYDKEVDQADVNYAYVLQMRLCDPVAIKAEAERLLNEVVADYGDVGYLNTRHREMEAMLKQTPPMWNGRPLTKDELKQLEAQVRDKGTLGKFATAKLDEVTNIVEGKPAPEINGVDVEGKPLKLSDYRGKVVVLVFWGSWCGPCMREVPRERELAEKFKGKPFALLGVNCKETKEAALKAIKAEKMTWPSWHDGEDGPIQSLYHIEHYPTMMVIDAQGIIRAKGLLGDGLDTFVEELLKEVGTEAKAEGQ